MIAIQLLRPKALAAYTLTLLITLTTAAVTFTLLYGLHTTLTTALGGVSEGTLILQKEARSVYTSGVPLTLAQSLNNLPGVQATALTLTPTTLQGTPIIFRGVTNTSTYHDHLVEGNIRQGASLLLGIEAQRRTRLQVGDIVFATSPLTPTLIPLTVTGIYQVGNLQDYEAVVPLNIGLALANKPQGLATTIQVKGLGPEALLALLQRAYTLTLSYTLPPGEIQILDSATNPVDLAKVEGNGTTRFTLPFGYYTITYRQSYFTTNVTSLLLTQDQMLTITKSPAGKARLKVLAPLQTPPVLQLDDGSILQGTWSDGAWLFEAPTGLHTLQLNNSIMRIPILGDTVFNTERPTGELAKVTVRVYWQDGATVNNYLLTVWSLPGELIGAYESPSTPFTLLLPPGQYKIQVMKPPYTLMSPLTVPDQPTLDLTLPAFSRPERLPPELFQRIKAIAPLDATSLTLGSLVGVTASALLALTLTLALLAAFTVPTVHHGLYAAAHDNLRILQLLGATPLHLLKLTGPTTLTITLALSLLASLLTTLLYDTLHLNLQLTVLGYGLSNSPLYTVAYALILGLTSWLLAAAKLTPTEEP